MKGIILLMVETCTIKQLIVPHLLKHPLGKEKEKKTAVIDHIVARSSSKMVYAACKNKNGLCHVGANKVISIFLPYEN